MREYHINFAGMDYHLKMDSDVKIHSYHKSFIELTDRKDESAKDVFFSAVEEIAPIPEQALQKEERFYEKGETWHTEGSSMLPVAHVQHGEPGIRGTYLASIVEHRITSTTIFRWMEPETVLLMNGGLLLHASLIACRGKGILFCAPSGVGKSTQASLWQKYEGAQIINGDRAGIMPDGEMMPDCEMVPDGERFRAWGMPVAGTSGIYRNESVPVDAIVLLSQAPYNELHRVSVREAFVKMWPETTFHRWNTDQVQLATDVLTRLLMSVPVYSLACLPDQGAVELLKKELD